MASCSPHKEEGIGWVPWVATRSDTIPRDTCPVRYVHVMVNAGNSNTRGPKPGSGHTSASLLRIPAVGCVLDNANATLKELHNRVSMIPTVAFPVYCDASHDAVQHTGVRSLVLQHCTQPSAAWTSRGLYTAGRLTRERGRKRQVHPTPSTRPSSTHPHTQHLDMGVQGLCGAIVPAAVPRPQQPLVARTQRRKQAGGVFVRDLGCVGAADGNGVGALL